MPGFEDHYVNVGGIKTRYWQAGTGRSPVLLLHGIGCSVLDWEPNITKLATQHRVYALDMLGYGLTEKPRNETYTGPRLTQFVLDFLTSQKIHRAHFAGFSLGGRVILECAMTAPERVASTLLLAPAGLAREGMLMHFRLATIPFLGEMILQPTAERLQLFWRLAFSDPSFVTSEFIAARLKLALQPGAKEAFLKTLRDGLNWRGVRTAYVIPLREALPLMKMPMLVIWGKQDNFISPTHAEVFRRLPNVQIKLYDRCGHLPQIECAERFNQTALSFWEEVDNQERGPKAGPNGAATYSSSRL